MSEYPKILKVWIIKPVDDLPDTSTLGEYHDNKEEWSIYRRESEYVHNLPEDYEFIRNSRNFAFFRPYAGGEQPGTEEYQKYGKQDYERMEGLNNGQWCYIGVIVKAEIQLHENGVVQTIQSGGLWGIESDATDYIEEVIEEGYSSLKSELAHIGCSKEQIAEAFGNLRQEN